MQVVNSLYKVLHYFFPDFDGYIELAHSLSLITFSFPSYNESAVILYIFSLLFVLLYTKLKLGGTAGLSIPPLSYFVPVSIFSIRTLESDLYRFPVYIYFIFVCLLHF